MSHMRNSIIICFLVTFQCSLAVRFFPLLKPGYPKYSIKVIKEMKSHKSYISFIVDKEKNLYIIKQVQRTDPISQFYSVREILAAYIAQEIGMPAHKVRLLPVGLDFPGKPYRNRPATIHTVVPGDVVTNAPVPYNTYIHQPIKDSVPKEKWGLTIDVLRNMAIHPMLPVITAYDTFIGNGDRHRKNFFYDTQTNQYYAIDLESSFDKNLGSYACDCVRKLIDRPHEFTKAELKAIVIYRNTLEKLVHAFPLYRMQKLLDDFVQESGIRYCFLRSMNAFNHKINLYKTSMAKNYDSVVQLLRILDRFIQRYPEQTGEYAYEYTQQGLPLIDEIFDRIQSYERAYQRRHKINKKFDVIQRYMNAYRHG